MPFLLIRNDITNMEVDVIVNPANTTLQKGDGTSGEIYEKAGEEGLTKACEKIGYCQVGHGVITPGFHLPAKYIIHGVGPMWQGGNENEEDILYQTYQESLKLASMYHLESIAFPLLSSGYYGFPKEKAFHVAVRAIVDFLKDSDMMVYLVLYDAQSLQVSKKLISSIEEYIDDHYVEEMESLKEMESCEKIRGSQPDTRKNSQQIIVESSLDYPLIVEECNPVMAPSPSKRCLEDLIQGMEETFSQMLLRFIDEKNMTDAQTYQKANIDRRLFSKIRNNINYSPSKKTIIAFAIALELSLDETMDLLKKAGYALSNSSKFDVIISYFMEQKQYDVYKINEMLFFYEEPTLGE